MNAPVRNLSRAGKSARLTPMRTFRLLLTLLLCLTVPVAGWASVIGGPLCPPSEHASSAADSNDHEADAAAAHHADASDHHHSSQNCGDKTTSGKPCKGDHCGCGCGMSACSASAASLAAPFISMVVYAGMQLLPAVNDAPHAGTRNSSPLRPPIS